MLVMTSNTCGGFLRSRFVLAPKRAVFLLSTSIFLQLLSVVATSDPAK